MAGSFLIPDLLEKYMMEKGYTKHWITVQEIRACFQPDCPSGQAISGFLGRNHNGAFAACRYKVTRIEKFRDATPPYRIIRRYLVQERAVKRHSPGIGTTNREKDPENFSTASCPLHRAGMSARDLPLQ